MNYHQIPSITRRNGRYAGNTLVGCAAAMMRLAVAGMIIAIAIVAMATFK